jgi:hypothetical protein
MTKMRMPAKREISGVRLKFRFMGVSNVVASVGNSHLDNGPVTHCKSVRRRTDPFEGNRKSPSEPCSFL